MRIVKTKCLLLVDQNTFIITLISLQKTSMHTQFKTQDGVTLHGQIFPAECPKATIILNPGTATKTSFYIPFAQFLASKGYSVMLWNYRGFCESRTDSLATSSILFSDIGRWDIPAAIQHAQSIFTDLPLYCIGHSAGGQQLGFAHNCNQLSGMIAIAASTGYFGGMPLSYRLKAKFFFKVFSPISTALFGYVRCKAFNFMEDLPPKLAQEWGRWCRKENFFFDTSLAQHDPWLRTYRQFEFPIHVLTADDDEISTHFNTNGLWKNIRSTQPIQFHCYVSAGMPKRHIGHFGYFRRSHQSIWLDILNRLETMHEQLCVTPVVHPPTTEKATFCSN